MPQFDVSTFYSQIFWLAIVFSFLYLVVALFVSPATEQIFSTRKIVIDNMVHEAEQLAADSEKLKKEYDISYKNILSAAEEIKKESVDNLNNFFVSKNKDLLVELDQKKEKSLSEIKLKHKDFLSEQPQACIDLADFIIQKITDKKLDMAILKQCYEKVK